MNSSTAGTSERTLRSMLAILFVQFGPSVIFRAEADSDYASKSREGQNKCNIREIIMTVAIKDQKWDCREMPLGPSGVPVLDVEVVEAARTQRRRKQPPYRSPTSRRLFFGRPEFDGSVNDVHGQSKHEP